MSIDAGLYLRWPSGQPPCPEHLAEALGLSATADESFRARASGSSTVWDVAPRPESTGKESPGDFREHDIAVFAEDMTPPKRPLVPAQVEQGVSEVCTFGQKIESSAEPGRPLPEILAGVRNRFERIHPFLDGNGRTGRLVTNLVLVRLATRRSSSSSASARPIRPRCAARMRETAEPTAS